MVKTTLHCFTYANSEIHGNVEFYKDRGKFRYMLVILQKLSFGRKLFMFILFQNRANLFIYMISTYGITTSFNIHITHLQKNTRINFYFSFILSTKLIENRFVPVWYLRVPTV